MEEIWKVTMVNKDYEVSNLGNVKSNKGGMQHLLKPFKANSSKKHEDEKGFYLSVRLLENGKEKDFRVHRLVAMAFIPNPLNLPQVNHKNGIRNDNRVENLEWCDNSYNIWHSYNVLGNKSSLGKPICQYTKEGCFIRKWDSISSASKHLDIDSSSIAAVCQKNSNRKLAGGYIWRYENDNDVSLCYDKTSPVIQISKYGEQLRRFNTIKEAAEAVGVTIGGISGCCQKRQRGYNYAGGYLWRYENDYNDNEFGYYLDKTFIKMTNNNIFVDEYKGTHDLVDNSECDLVKVIMCCRGQRTSTNGFKWCIKEEGDKTRVSKREKPVVQLNKDFSFICEYDSAVRAAASTNLCANNITFSCKHKGKYNVKGYKWMYKEDYDNMYNLIEVEKELE